MKQENTFDPLKDLKNEVYKAQLPKFLPRALAYIIDAVLSLMLMMILMISFPKTPMFYILIQCFFFLGIYRIFFHTMFGQTPGKAILNLRVVSVESGLKPELNVSIRRYLPYALLSTSQLLLLVSISSQMTPDMISAMVNTLFDMLTDPVAREMGPEFQPKLQIFEIAQKSSFHGLNQVSEFLLVFFTFTNAVLAIVSPLKQTFNDKFAGTLVLKNNVDLIKLLKEKA